MKYIIEEYYDNNWHFYTANDSLDILIEMAFGLKMKDKTRQFRIIRLEGRY